MRQLLTVMIIGLFVALLASGCAVGAGEATVTSAPPDSETEAAQPAETEAPEEESSAPEEAAPEETVVPEEPAATEAPEEETGAGGDWTPATSSVWTLSRDPVATASTEACPEPIHFDFYGLVAIAPVDGGLTWQRQTSVDTLEWIDTNHYAGPAQSVLPGYSLTIDVTFTSATTLTVIHTLTPEDTPDCNHTFEYTGDFSW
jgi:hypothetical protein